MHTIEVSCPLCIVEVPVVQCSGQGELAYRLINEGLECQTSKTVQARDDLVDCQIRHRTLESGVLRFELPQPLRLIDPQAPVALAPAKAWLFRHPDLLDDLRDRLPLADRYIGLSKLIDDLLGRVSLLPHPPRLLFSS